MEKLIIKTLDIVLEENACTYYGVTPDFFRIKAHDSLTDRRRVLFWLLYTEASMNYRQIARRYGYSHSSIAEGVKKIDFRRDVITNISRDIKNILRLSQL